MKLNNFSIHIHHILFYLFFFTYGFCNPISISTSPTEAAHLTLGFLKKGRMDLAASYIFRVATQRSLGAHHWSISSKPDYSWGSSYPNASIEKIVHIEPLNLETAPNNFLVQFVNEYLSNEFGKSDSNVKFLMRVFLENERIHEYLNAVIDGIDYSLSIETKAKLIGNEISDAFAKNPSSKIFSYINPFNYSLFRSLRSDKIRVEMLRPFLHFRHTYYRSIILQSEHDKYETLLRRMKEILSVSEYSAEVLNILKSAFRIDFALSAKEYENIRLLVSEFLTTEPSDEKVKAYFNEDFFKSQLFKVHFQGPGGIKNLKTFAELSSGRNASIAAQAVLEYFKSNPNYFSDLETSRELISTYLVDAGKDTILFELFKVPTLAGTLAQKNKHLLYAEYAKTPSEPFPSLPGIIVPKIDAPVGCYRFYRKAKPL